MKGLKIVLWICAIYYLLGFVFAAFPWSVLTAWAQWCGYQAVAPAEPLSVFTVRLSLGVFGLIGIFLLMLALNPLKYGGMLLLAGCGTILIGLFCLAGGIRYSLPFGLYGTDVIVNIIVGILVLIFRKTAMKKASG